MLENAQENVTQAIINTDALKANKSCHAETVTRWSVAEIETLFALPCL